MSRNPLFDVMLSVQNNESAELGISNEIEESEYNSTKFDLTFDISEENGIYEVSLEYSTDLFRKETTERILKHYEEVLKEY